MLDRLIADAEAAGTPIDGADGLLNQMTKAVLERGLQTEMTHHLGYERDDSAGHGTGNSRNCAPPAAPPQVSAADSYLMSRAAAKW